MFSILLDKLDLVSLHERREVDASLCRHPSAYVLAEYFWKREKEKKRCLKRSAIVVKNIDSIEIDFQINIWGCKFA